MAVKYGEFISAKLKPSWESKTKPGKDSNGWKRGAIGCDDLYDADGKDYMKTANPKADAEFYGSGPAKRRADAIESLTDRFKGSYGVDAGDDSDGVR